MTKASAIITYSSFVPIETVRIELITIALNDLEAKSVAYIEAPMTE